MSDPDGTIPVDLGDGRHGRLHLVRLDRHGALLSPRNRDAFLADAAAAPDAFVFSHGWNNDYGVAVGAYRSFLSGYVGQGTCRGTPALLGIIWPATTFVFPWESGPAIAGGRPASVEDQLADLVDDEEARAALTGLLGDGTHDVEPDDAGRAAAVVASLGTLADDEAGASAPTGSQVAALWNELSAEGTGEPTDDGDESWGTADQHVGAGPAAAGLRFDPRVALRMLSVWKMKARAGVIGSHGVGPVVRELLASTEARLHLTGHSFGARVVLSALSYGEQEPARPARSMLLLQPAVNRWCFAPDLGDGRPGGYAPALRRVELPVVTTYSNRDIPLHDVFHRVMGVDHVGEPTIAGSPATDRYGALGGYGPNAGLGAVVEHVGPAATYPLAVGSPTRLVAVDGGQQPGAPAAITGHGDVSNATTWRAQRSLVEA